MPESIPSSSSFDSAFWGQKGMGSCDLLHDKITLGGRDDSFWMRSTDSIPAMLKSSKGQEPERPTLSRSESTSSLDNSFWGRKPECNLLADDISLGGDDDSFWVKSDDESASECGEEFLTPASTSPETFESSPPHEPEVETEESPCEDVTFRAPLKEGTDEPEQPVKTPASPQRGRSSRVKALQNLDQFVDLPTPLAAPFELPTTSGDASSTPISIAKRTERRHPLATASD
ncbi:hypothetical protein C8Q73DRAFT_680008 [Cubamyces lactineus]|nr:hypothetical protein C8Q73DRAFT_680008 [Cubamyces lactineus]